LLRNIYPFGELVYVVLSIETEAYLNKGERCMKTDLSSLADLWRPAAVRQHQWSDALRRFRSICVERRSRHADGLAYGQALWGAADSAQPMALFWEWSELSPGVVALADPLRVLSNVTLLSSDGLKLGERLALLELNCAVHGLDWQPEVRDLLSGGGRGRGGKGDRPGRNPISRHSIFAQAGFLLAA
jgi:hypothetical protein